MTYAFTIGPEHVGKVTVKHAGRVWFSSGWIGRILPGDVGKRVYLADGGYLAVETDSQRSERLAR